jgi:hypothetical protein
MRCVTLRNINKFYMMRHLTQNDLLLLAYNELPAEEHAQMLGQVRASQPLLQEYNQILEDIAILSSISYAPQATSVQIILEESCSSSSLEMI